MRQPEKIDGIKGALSKQDPFFPPGQQCNVSLSGRPVFVLTIQWAPISPNDGGDFVARTLSLLCLLCSICSENVVPLYADHWRTQKFI